MKERIAEMAERVAQAEEEDDALSNVDQAIDTMIASLKIIEDNLSEIETENVPQKAAVDSMKDLVDTALKPYLFDFTQAMQIFGE